MNFIWGANSISSVSGERCVVKRVADWEKELKGRAASRAGLVDEMN